MKIRVGFLLCLLSSLLFASSKEVHLHCWNDEISDSIIQQFTKETGITVKKHYLDQNEGLYAQLKVMKKNQYYDVITPSGYFTQRMAKENLLHAIDIKKLNHFKNLNAFFLEKYQPIYYGFPYIWGATGIFVNDKWFDPTSVQRFEDFWEKRFHHRLAMVNDPRDLFAMALLTLGYSANDEHPAHIQQAYEKLCALLPNIKVFLNEGITTLMIDDDVGIGMVWNPMAYRAQRENAHIHFIYPKDGFTLWTDDLAIVEGAPNLENAYRLIDFLLRSDIAKQVTLEKGYATTIQPVKALLPQAMQENKVLYPSPDMLQKAEFQADVSDTTLQSYHRYWQRLKRG